MEKAICDRGYNRTYRLSPLCPTGVAPAVPGYTDGKSAAQAQGYTYYGSATHLRRFGEEVRHLELVSSASASILSWSDPRQRGEAGGLREGRLLEHLLHLPPLLLVLFA